MWFWGFFGGFLFSIIPYIEKLSDIHPEVDTKKSEVSIDNWKYVQKTFNMRGILYCVFCGLFGVVLVLLIEPKESLYAVYLGFTAYPTMAKFHKVYHQADNHT